MKWLVLAIVVAASTARADAPKIDYTRFTLPNGLDVYVIEDHKAPVVYEVMWVRVGSKDEVAHRTGFAHLFEHLMFKGSAHIPDGLMDKLLESAGGWSNAFTSTDETVYQNVAGSNFLEQVLWGEADRLAGLTDTLDQKKLDNQRDVVLNERRQSYENQPYGMSSLYLDTALWPRDHGYHWSTIGYPDDIKAAALPEVKAFFAKYYVPNNIAMVIAGDVKPDDVKRLVTKYFAWIPRQATPARPTYATPPAQQKTIAIDTTDDVQVPRTYIAYRGTPAYSPDEAPLDVAASILADGKSSRLYKRLVYDEKIAQTVGAGDETREIGGEFRIVVTAKPGTDPKRLCREVEEEVEKLAQTPPDRSEVERAVNSHESQFLDGLEPTLSRAIQLANYVVLAHDPDYFGKDLARYRAVTPQQVTDVAAKYLKKSARVVLTINPGKKPAEEPK
ncbi:MAG TPA: pitrilysin family protein [Kofleriaceae bacterium]|jgi:zinc protease